MEKNRNLGRNPYLLDLAIRGAHTICNKLFLFDAVNMSDRDIRKILRKHDIAESELQDSYIEYVRMYKVVCH